MGLEHVCELLVLRGVLLQELRCLGIEEIRLHAIIWFDFIAHLEQRPSDCIVVAIVYRSLVPMSVNNSRQNEHLKILSRSEIMESDTPGSLIAVSRNVRYLWSSKRVMQGNEVRVL